MDWIQSNWIWIALGIGFLALHMFGHGGHAHGHGGHSRDSRRDRSPTNNEPTATKGQDNAGTGVTTFTSLNDPARRGATDHAGHGSSPTPVDEKRHSHGC